MNNQGNVNERDVVAAGLEPHDSLSREWVAAMTAPGIFIGDDIVCTFLTEFAVKSEFLEAMLNQLVHGQQWLKPGSTSD